MSTKNTQCTCPDAYSFGHEPGCPILEQPKKDTLIYSRKHSDGDAYWWRPNGSGYTSDLNQAGRYTAEEAAACCRSTHGDNVPVPESVAMAIEARRTLYRRDIEDILSNVSRQRPLPAETDSENTNQRASG
jgi:hypothetical protein